MLELFGYLICGLIIGSASVVSGRMRAQQATLTVGAGLVGALIFSLTPHLGAPHNEVRAAIAAHGLITLWFFLAFLAALVYGCLQILATAAPEELAPGLRRWENAAVTFGGAMLILGLAATKLTLAAVA